MTIGFKYKVNGIVYDYHKQFETKSLATKYRKELNKKGIRAIVREDTPDYKGDRSVYVVFIGGKK